MNLHVPKNNGWTMLSCKELCMDYSWLHVAMNGLNMVVGNCAWTFCQDCKQLGMYYEIQKLTFKNLQIDSGMIIKSCDEVYAFSIQLQTLQMKYYGNCTIAMSKPIFFKIHSKMMKIIQSKIDTKEGITKFKDDCDFA
jgi:hypothetical protein